MITAALHAPLVQKYGPKVLCQKKSLLHKNFLTRIRIPAWQQRQRHTDCNVARQEKSGVF